MDWLLKDNVEVNPCDDNYGWTPLYRPVTNGFTAIVAQLLEINGVDAQAKMECSLDTSVMAMRSGQKEIAGLFFTFGKLHTTLGEKKISNS